MTKEELAAMLNGCEYKDMDSKILQVAPNVWIARMEG